MFSPVVFYLTCLIAAVSGKSMKCRCGDEVISYTIPIFESKDVKDLRFTQLDFPEGDYGSEFRLTLQTLVGSFAHIRDQMREQGVDNKYILEIDTFLTELTTKINGFGSFSNNKNFEKVIRAFDLYLTQQLGKFTDYIKTITDNNVKNYYYSLILQILSSRSFFASSLDNTQCIYSKAQHSGPGVPRGGGGKRNNSGEHQGGGGKQGGTGEHQGGGGKPGDGGKPGNPGDKGKGGKPTISGDKGKGGKPTISGDRGKGGKPSHPGGPGTRVTVKPSTTGGGGFGSGGGGFGSGGGGFGSGGGGFGSG